MGRTYEVDDEGDYYEVHLIEDGQKVGGALIDLELIGDDLAFDLARMFGECFIVSALPRSVGFSQAEVSSSRAGGPNSTGAH